MQGPARGSSQVSLPDPVVVVVVVVVTVTVTVNFVNELE
jgi:hypothetical protein